MPSPGQGNSMRTRSIVLLSTVAGTVGAAAATSDSIFVAVFCFAFWAAIVGTVLLVAQAARSGEREELLNPEIVVVDPWVDADGVRHFPGDVFDIENHPRTGAHGHI